MIRRDRQKLTSAELTRKFAEAHRAAQANRNQPIPPEMPLMGGKLRKSSIGYGNRNKTRPPEEPATEPSADGSDQSTGELR